MIFLRKILFPFAIIYGWITQFRNFLFDVGIIKSYSFELPIIVVGNLSVGGTGKTPQIEYLIRLLGSKFKLATLSRGYKRKSEGFILANNQTFAETIGDEPFQFYKKFPAIQVAVDADRKNGIEQLLLQAERPEIILLDDAFQHRKVKAGFYILLTAFDDLFCDDYMLPTGNLRERRAGALRADVVIVTKCPATISKKEKEIIRGKINAKQPIFFTTISYDTYVYSTQDRLTVNEVKSTSKLLLAGIAKPKRFFEHIKQKNDIILEYPDHHHFTDSDIADINRQAKNNLIITTEKDYVRLIGKFPSNKLYYLPIQTSFIDDSSNFDAIILNYISSVN